MLICSLYSRFCVEGMRLLLDVSASTLVTLRLYPNNPRGEDVSLKLSRPTQLMMSQPNSSLRALTYPITSLHFMHSKSQR